MRLSASRSHAVRRHLGSSYGGWTICPTGLAPDSIIYSVGVGEDISFDLELIESFRCRVWAFDPTPRSIAWIKNKELPPEFKLIEVGIANHDGEADFFPPEDPTHISHSLLYRPETALGVIRVQVLRLNSIMRWLGHGRIDLLKMDIEGAEYDVIEDILSTSVRPEQMLVEFHHSVRDAGASRTMRAVFYLFRHGYRLFAVSSSGREYSFLYSGRGQKEDAEKREVGQLSPKGLR